MHFCHARDDGQWGVIRKSLWYMNSVRSVFKSLLNIEAPLNPYTETSIIITFYITPDLYLQARCSK